MKTTAGSQPSDPTPNPPDTKTNEGASSSGDGAPPSGPAPVSVSGLAALTEDEAARFQQGSNPQDIKADLRSTTEAVFLGNEKIVSLDLDPEFPEGKLIAAAILELFKVSGHPVPSHLASGLREIAERGYLAR